VHLYKLRTDYRDFSTTSRSILFLELLHSHSCIIRYMILVWITSIEYKYKYIWFALYFRFSRNIHNAFNGCRDSFTRPKKYHRLLTDSFDTGLRHATASLSPVTAFLEASTVICIQGGVLCQLHTWIRWLSILGLPQIAEPLRRTFNSPLFNWGTEIRPASGIDKPTMT
jgi:hypothetical protein